MPPGNKDKQKSASVATSSLFAALEEMEQELVSAPTGISAGRADEHYNMYYEKTGPNVLR